MSKDVLRKKFIDLCTKYDTMNRAVKKMTGMQCVNTTAEIQQLKNKIGVFKDVLFSTKKGAFYTQKFLENTTFAKTYSATLCDAKRSFIYDKLGVKKTENVNLVEELKFAVSLDEPLEDTQKRSVNIDNYAKKVLSEEDYQEYVDTVYGTIPLIPTVAHAEELVDIFLNEMSEEDAERCNKEMDEYVLFEDRSDEELTIPAEQELLPELKTQATKESEQEALDYIEKNVRIAIPEYGKHLFDLTSTMMGQQSGEYKRLCDEYFKDNPQYKDVYSVGISGGREVNPEKRKEYEELKNAEYRLSEKSKNAMKEIMHKIDDMGIITINNINEAEEGTKKYAMVAVFNAVENIENAMKKKDVAKLPELVNKHKIAKAQCDELLNIAHENFSDNKLLYGGNVDVARTSEMPIEYRRDNRGVSQVSELMSCLKLCKRYNIPIDDFVEKPKYYMGLIKQDMFRKYDMNEVTKGKSLGQTLYMLEHKPSDTEIKFDADTSALIMRAEEGFKCFDPDEIEYNTMLQEFSHNMGYENLNTFIRTDFLLIQPDVMIRNMIVFGEGKKMQEYTGNVMANYDLNTQTRYNSLDADGYIKNSDNIDYDIIADRMIDMYDDYMEATISDGRYPKADYINAIKGVADKIEQLRPQDAQNEAFLRLKETAKNITTNFSIEKVVEIVNDRNEGISEKAKDISLGYIKDMKKKYVGMDFSTRFFSWFPFVENDATKLRHKINDSKALLVSKGADKAEINKEVDDEYDEKWIVPENPDYKIKFGKLTDITVHRVNGKKAPGYDIEKDLSTYISGKAIIAPKSDKQEINVEETEIQKTINENDQIDLDKSGIFDPAQIKKMLEETDKEYGNLDDLGNDKLHENLAKSTNLDTSTIKTEKVAGNDVQSANKTLE